MLKKQLMRNILFIISLIAAVCSCGVLHVEAKAEDPLADVPVNMRKDVQKAVLCIKRLPGKYKEALLAEVYGLLYMNNGNDPFVGEGADYIENERVPYKSTDNKASFIGTDGKVYNFNTLARDKEKKAKIQDNWIHAKLYLSHVGSKVVRPQLESVLRQMETKWMEFWLKQMPEKYLDAFIAEECGLMYEPGKKKSALTGEMGQESLRGINISYKRYSRDARFTSLDGKEYSFKEISKERYDHLPLVQGLWVNGRYFMFLMGPEKFLSFCAERVEKLKAVNKLD